MIVDTHIHLYDPSRPQGVPWPPPDNQLLYRTVLPAHYQELAEPLGIGGAVVVEASAWLEDNRWVLDLTAQNPFILGLVGHVDPGREGFAPDLERLAADPHFLGIRCGRSFFDEVPSGRLLEDMARLVALDLALDVLIDVPQIDGLLGLAERLPDLRIVVDHIAHMPIDGRALDPAWVDRYRRLAQAPQIYLKVSALMELSTVQPAPADLEFYRPLLDALWATFGPQRLIFGSNWPVLERAGELREVLGIVQTYWQGKGPQAAERFFYQNARSVYRWPERTATGR